MSSSSAIGTTIAGATTGEIGYVKSIDYTGLRRKVITFPYLTMPNGYVIKRPGTVDCGSLDLECWQDFLTGDASKHRAAVLALAADSVEEEWTITFPGGVTMKATGHITSCVPFDTIENDHGIGFRLGIKLNSRPALA